MPKRATHTFESEKDGLKDEALGVQYCMSCGESVLILGPETSLTDLPRRRTDGAIVLERGTTTFKLNAKPLGPKVIKRAAGFERPTLLTGSRALAVIADTSGLHARARQAPGRVRTQILPPIPLLPRLPPTDPLPKLAGEAVGGGRNCAPRRNVFHCASHTLQCALP